LTEREIRNIGYKSIDNKIFLYLALIIKNSSNEKDQIIFLTVCVTLPLFSQAMDKIVISDL